jgi:hypothetical protein
VQRASERLLSAAIDYCAADALSVRARKQLAELRSLHDPDQGICCIPPEQTDFDSDPPEALPRSNWCEHCKEYAKNGIDGSSATWGRRSARQRMTRAYRKIIALRQPLAEQVIGLYRAGSLRKHFTVMDVAHQLKGRFSDSQVRDGLAALAEPGTKLRDARFKRIAKYKYEVIEKSK